MSKWTGVMAEKRRGMARAGVLAAMAATSLLAACTRPIETGPSREEIWKQVYVSRLENLRALDQAFNELGQEYYKLEIEYRSAGREDLAVISRERAKAFHEQHLEFQKRIGELESTDARLRRGDSAGTILSGPGAAGVSTPVQTEPAAQLAPAAPAPAPPRPALTTPARTPTPSPTGGRLSEPIIITDPRIEPRE